jgi:hypothetical protein
MQEQQKQIEELKKQNTELQERLNKMEQMIKKLVLQKNDQDIFVKNNIRTYKKILLPPVLYRCYCFCLLWQMHDLLPILSDYT